jgi:crotonobetainyl-CoA:carnitine CoA-transferase CaiB-like acyl-CoA transferase
VKTTLLPFTLAGERLGVRIDPPRLGEHSRELLQSVGLTDAQIDQLKTQAVVA